MNIFCKKTGIINARLCVEIEYVKDKRNEIHLQGLTSTKRTFTKPMIDRVADVIALLFLLIDNAPLPNDSST